MTGDYRNRLIAGNERSGKVGPSAVFSDVLINLPFVQCNGKRSGCAAGYRCVVCKQFVFGDFGGNCNLSVIFGSDYRHQATWNLSAGIGRIGVSRRNNSVFATKYIGGKDEG